MSAQGDIPELRRTKIVIMVESFARSGAVRQAYLLARDFRKTYGLDVEVWALSEGELPRTFEAAAIPTRAVGFVRSSCPVLSVRLFLWAVRLAKVAYALRRAGVGILLSFGSAPNVVAGFSYRVGGVQLCIWGERAVYRMSREAKAASRHRHFVANSAAGVEYLLHELRVAAHRITCIPNAVEEPVPIPGADWRARLGLSPDQFLVVKLADIQSPRDHATLIRAWELVQANWPGRATPVLALAGRFGEAHAECRRLVRESRMDASVRFLGPIKDAQTLIAACDLAIFSSCAEGMPNAVLEYMAAGKAVVASDLPGIRNALGTDGTNLLFPVGDAQRCAELVLKLLPDVRARTAIGESNRNRAMREFSVNRMAVRYLDVIRGKTSDIPISNLDIAGQALAPAPGDA